MLSSTTGVAPPLTVFQQLSQSKKCGFCLKELQYTFFIQCANCENMTFCADCFSAGVEVGEHVNTHAYRVPVCLENAIFDNSWSIKEELLLLSAIEKHGVGNWKVIAENLNTGKTAKQIEDHYWLHYLGVHGYCLPCEFLDEDKQVSKVSNIFPPSEDADNSLPPIDADNYRIPVIEGYARGDPVIRDNGQGSGSGGGGNKPKDRNEINSKIAQLPGSEIPGYMPLRQDFEVEFENDAELLLADMEFLPDDHPSERELKLQVIRIYNQKLEERAKRRHFVIERNLVDVKGQQAKEKKLTKDERELVGKLRVFARFHSHEEHEALVDGILKAQRLKNQIELYKVYRQMGLKTLEQVRKFESDRRNYLKNTSRNSSTATAGGGTGNGRSSSAASKADNSNPYSMCNFTSSSSLADDMDSYGGSGSGGAGGNDRPKKRGRPPKHNANYVEEEVVEKRTAVASSSSSTRPNKSTRSSTGGLTTENLSSSYAVSGVVDPEESFKFIQKAPGGDLLASNELELCMKLPLFPYHYLAVKDVLVREAHRNGMLTMDGVKRILKIDDDKSAQIYDFFVRELKINEAPKRHPSSSHLSGNA